MAIHSSILAWRIPWTEEPCGLQSMGSQESDTTEGLHYFTTTMVYGGFPGGNSGKEPAYQSRRYKEIQV